MMQRSMHIALLMHSLNPRGGVVHTLELAEALIDRGHRVTLIDSGAEIGGQFKMSKRIPGRQPLDLSRDVVFGHEFCGEVLDYGPGTERKLKPGTLVCSMPVVPQADGMRTVGYSNDFPGGYGERMVLAARSV